MEYECYRELGYNEDFTECDEMKHIFGVLSVCPQGATKANLVTMNDLEVTYMKKESKYMLGVETMLFFDDGRQGERNYLQFLLDRFTEFMIENNYDTSRELELYQVFTEGININSEFESLEDAYAAFKFFVRGY